MNLVDEQHIARLQIGEQGGQIAGPLEHGTRGLPQVHAELARQDVRERRLAETRRSEDERMIERFAALHRGLHVDLELRLDLLLANIVREPLRPDGAIDRLLFDYGGGLHDAFWNQLVRRHCGRTAPCSARRMRSSVDAAWPAKGLSIWVTSAGL